MTKEQAHDFLNHAAGHVLSKYNHCLTAKIDPPDLKAAMILVGLAGELTLELNFIERVQDALGPAQ